MIAFLSVRDNWDTALSVGMILFFGSLILFSVWFHLTIKSVPGGRALMAWQRRNPALIGVAGPGLLKETVRLIRDIRAGKYGPQVRRRMKITYWFFAIWIGVAITWFGFLIYVDTQITAGS